MAADLVAPEADVVGSSGRSLVRSRESVECFACCTVHYISPVQIVATFLLLYIMATISKQTFRSIPGTILWIPRWTFWKLQKTSRSTSYYGSAQRLAQSDRQCHLLHTMILRSIRNVRHPGSPQRGPEVRSPFCLALWWFAARNLPNIPCRAADSAYIGGHPTGLLRAVVLLWVLERRAI